MIKIKICGITNLEDALLCSEKGADAVGFIFSKKSPRYIKKQEAARIINKLDPFMIKVGVFLDEEKDKVLDIASTLNLDVLQFHGKESPAYCNFFKKKFKIIKVFFPEDKPIMNKISLYHIDAYMFDIKYEQKIKGIKKLSDTFLDDVSEVIKSGKRVIISGGLNVNNIDKVKKLKPYAFDIASGVEQLVGRKDKNLVDLFIKKAN